MDCDTAFKQLQHALAYASVLAMPGFDANFIIETDASDVSGGTVLIQHYWLVFLMSKVLNSVQHNYCTTDCKLLPIVLACKIWHPYLGGKKTVVLTDNKPPI